MRVLIRFIALSAFVALIAVSTFAQTTGSLTGTVTSDKTLLPGATITISSADLQGVRATVSGPNGDYNFAALPPGRYHITFELQGLQTVTQNVNLNLAEVTRADADLKVGRVAQSITVTANAPSILETPTVSTSLTREQIEALPVGRTIAQRIQIAPGVNNDGPNNQTVINGAPSYDNLYMVNGVVVNDTIRGQPENLFIEDAIQETTLLTGGVSAEYGRFTGGVVNTITKSGGNSFTGSLRDNLTNPTWTRVTAFKDPITGAPQPANISARSNQYEATLGGFLMKDRVWFFGAGRKFNQETSNVTTGTTIPFLNTSNNKRYEAKLTGQITSKHTLVGSYLHNGTNEVNNRFGNIVDLASLTARQLPNWLEAGHYSGVLTNSLLIEGQYSRRYFAFVGGGGPKGVLPASGLIPSSDSNFIAGTLLRDNSNGRRAWSPTFCACDPKTRNNKDYSAKANYFLSTKSMGSHNIVGGYDAFHELRHENNFQSGNDFRLWGDFIYVGKDVFFHADPVNGFVEWTPIAALSRTSDASTQSVFANDKWDFNNHWSFNVGARYDKNNAVDQSRNKTANDSAVSPRLGAIYDVTGDGRNRISASYAKYVSHIDNGINDSVAIAGSPGSIYYNYRGPEINPSGTPTSQLVPTAQVIKMVFDWFNSVGSVNGYKDIYSISIPGLTAKLNGSLKSPNAQEYAVGYGRQIGANGYVRADLIHRSYSDFYSSFTDTTTSQSVDVNGNKVDVSVIANSSNGLSRKYDGIQTQAAYRIHRVNLGGNYTFSKLRGNVEGETFNNATVTAGNNNYPEFTKFAQNLPVGYLNEDIRHRLNVYGSYDFALPWGSLNLGLLERYHSGAPFSAVGSVLVGSPSKGAPRVIPNPNNYYATPPAAVSYYFRPRGSFRLDSISETDFTAQYTLPTFSKVNIFLRGDLLNAFNQQGVEFAGTGLGAVVENRVYTAFSPPRRSIPAGQKPTKFATFNPYTDTPVEFKPGMDPNGTYNYMLDPTFGQPTNKEAYQLPRTYRVAVGVRF